MSPQLQCQPSPFMWAGGGGGFAGGTLKLNIDDEAGNVTEAVLTVTDENGAQTIAIPPEP